MKQITREWLTFARKDIASCKRLLGDDFLTSVVAFHAQQAVEKSFKAIIEEFEIGFIRTHDLTRLYTIVKGHLGFDLDVEMIKRLNEVYIGARYPGELGLLPHGEPTVEEAGGFYEFARGVLEEVKLGLEQRAD